MANRNGPAVEADKNSELSRKSLLGRAAILAGGVFAVGLPGTARAGTESREGVQWNAAKGNFQSTFVTTSPASAADNLIQPLADVPALTLAQPPGGAAITSQLDFVRADRVTRIAGFVPGVAGVGMNSSGHFELRDVGSGHGPHTWSHQTDIHNGTVNPLMSLGYNADGAAAPVVAGEPVVAFAIEADYDNGSVRSWESYLQVFSASGTRSGRPMGFAGERDASTRSALLRDATFVGSAVYFNYPSEDGDVQMVKVMQNELILYAPNSNSPNAIRLLGPPGRHSQIRFGADTLEDVAVLEGGIGPRLSVRAGGNYVAQFGTTYFELHDAKDIVLGTATGTRIGTAVDQKLAFFNAAPVVQRPSHGAQTAGPGYGSRERNMLNDVYSGLRALGLLA